MPSGVLFLSNRYSYKFMHLLMKEMKGKFHELLIKICLKNLQPKMNCFCQRAAAHYYNSNNENLLMMANHVTTVNKIRRSSGAQLKTSMQLTRETITKEN